MNDNWIERLRQNADGAESACTAAPKGRHCWHDRGQWTDTGGQHRSRQCCHCGEFVQERVTPPQPIVPKKWEAPKHGPHAPPSASYF
jgi:hypothetical protein